MKILYVENHAPFAQIVVKTFLTQHEVVVVPSVAQARAKLQTGVFNAVLVDYDLDDGKGDVLVREIRQMPNVPFVVAVSSHKAGNDALQLAGANAVCSKLRFAEINETLARV